ncbi:hypothetical protein AAW14_06145 [Streptomyces hygroscopicus]|uniref:hypothetical protein n=1 Tax=Streptomyces hygroscopicus TaxID=1912 RepID=UPI0022402F90|nr:hypothetical protein [Streptomyces hygroscopicus]MCW7941625.1 hypothetical protein [Streptomyces hygroscopicus]
MTRERKAEIRRIAHDRAARELSAVIDTEMAERLFADEDEREEFELQMLRIIRALEAKGR